jgi:hypothetical protein
MYQAVIKYTIWNSHEKVFINDNEGSNQIQDAHLFDNIDDAIQEISSYNEGSIWEIVIVEVMYNYHLQHKVHKHNDLYLDYIDQYGYCGLHGTKWHKNKTDCSKCNDSNNCMRYKILNNIEIKFL